MTGSEKSLNAKALDDVAARTLGDYGVRAERFREQTADHDVSQNIAALLDAIEGPKPFTILDAGCGPSVAGAGEVLTFRDATLALGDTALAGARGATATAGAEPSDEAFQFLNFFSFLLVLLPH